MLSRVDSAVRFSGFTRSATYAALFVASIGVVGYAVVAYALLPLGSLVHPDMVAVFEANRLGSYAHVFGSAFALAFGPLQFSDRLRRSRPSLHRWSGRV